MRSRCAALLLKEREKALKFGDWILWNGFSPASLRLWNITPHLDSADPHKEKITTAQLYAIFDSQRKKGDSERKVGGSEI